MRTFLIISLVIIYSCIYGQDNNTECLSFFKRFEEPWKADSVGVNGFRSLVYFYLLPECRTNSMCCLVGLDWRDVREILGVPNQEYSGHVVYWMGADKNWEKLKIPFWIALRLNFDEDTYIITRFVLFHT